MLDITTIILTYNEEIHIRRCIENVNQFTKKVYIVDCFSTDKTAKIAKELGAEVIAMNITPNGENINHECGSTHPEGLKKAVIEHKADLGLAYDGDADRLIAVDEKGHEVDGDHIMILGAVYLKKQNKLANDTLVVTTMSNIGLHAAAKEYGIDLSITDVGDRYVIEEMKKSGLL